VKHPSGGSRILPAEGRTLPQLLRDRAAADPDTLAQRAKKKGIWKGISWNEVLEAVRGLAGGLIARGFGRGETIAVIGENEPEHFFAELAIQSIGAVCVSLYPDMTAEELEYILDHSEAVAIFAQDQEQTDKVLGALDKLPRLRALLHWDDKGMWSYRHPLLSHTDRLKDEGRRWQEANPGAFDKRVAEGKSSDTAVLLYTSGTTGRPKGVVCSHAFLIDNGLRLHAGASVKPGSEYLSYIPLAWSTEQFIGITLGLIAPLVVNFPERPESVLADLREIGVEVVFFGSRQWESLASSVRANMFDAGFLRRTFYDAALKTGAAFRIARLENRTPPLWSRLLQPLAEIGVLKPLRDKLGLVRAHAALCAGSAMAPDAFRLFHAIGVPLRNAYGATEFGIISIHQGHAFDLETAGSAVPVEAAFGAPIEWQFSEQGELLVKGGTGFSGYLKQGDKTAEKQTGDWFRTGDYCAQAPSGDLVFMDRLDDLKTLAGGQTYPPQYIESRLRFSSFIRDVMTVGDHTRREVAALIEIDGEVVSQWADERKVPFSTFSDLSQRPEVRSLVREEIARVNRLLPAGSRVCSFANFPKPLDPDEGELTRTRKLRRGFLADRYGGLIEALYANGASTDLEVPIRYQDGKRGTLRATVFVEKIEAASERQSPSPSPSAQLWAQAS
jgi:long-chain acyl-CoA synthetase